MSRGAWFLAPGAVFGAGLALSGMTNPAKVTGFLDVFGAWDPSLACVMGGAILAFVAGNWLARRNAAPVFGGAFPGKPAHLVDARVFVGEALFGIGWGLVGFCPGPAITNLGRMDGVVLAFVAMMVMGMLVAQRAFGVDP